MKKLVSLLLCIVILCGAASAFAEEYDRIWYSIETSSTSVYSVGHTPVDKWRDDWYIGIDSRSNVSSTHRAVGRVHCGAEAITPTFVFNGTSYNHHEYDTYWEYEAYGVTFRARLDNRDSGTLNFYGYYYY